ncbi:MAG: hypothetical protein M3R13_04275 [Armatimonadota bacterium]|nr:hypothetical protein [Armatimonadota bacterium]
MKSLIAGSALVLLLSIACSRDDEVLVPRQNEGTTPSVSERQAYERRSIAFFSKLDSSENLDFSSIRFLAYYLTAPGFDDLAPMALQRAVEVEPALLNVALAIIEAKAILSQEPDTTPLLLTHASLLGLDKLDGDLITEFAAHERRVSTSKVMDQEAQAFTEDCLKDPSFSRRLGALGLLLFASQTTTKPWAIALVHKVRSDRSSPEQFFWYVVEECMEGKFSDEIPPRLLEKRLSSLVWHPQPTELSISALPADLVSGCTPTFLWSAGGPVPRVARAKSYTGGRCGWR